MWHDALLEAGVLSAATALLGLAAYFAVAYAVTRRRLAAAAQRLTAALGPGSVAPTAGLSRLSLAASAIRPAMHRLDRAWREHAGRAEARLAAAEAVIAAVPDPLILIDRQRRIVRANAAAGEFIGPLAEPRDLAGALRNPALLAAADAVLAREAERSVEFVISVPVERVLRAKFARLDGPALDGAAAILTLHDVTALKRSEQMRADFIANAGHELKTPLASLVGFIETLLGPARDDAEARQRFLGIMREQAGRMTRLVDELLSLSRIELNEHLAPTGEVDAAALVEEVARGLELRAAERGIRIAPALPRDLPPVLGDRDELAQIFQNLLDNAIKYGRPNSEVKVTGGVADAAGGMVWLAVADQGDGIPDEHLPRLTERFYRVDRGRSRETGGTGLGLSIVKHALARHQAVLAIESAPGKGSRFMARFPAGRLAPAVQKVAG
jgi:two-component system phosphate regulon sensor histidine kinase PhoR